MNEYTQINEANMENLISTIVTKTISSLKNSFVDNEWMSLKEAAIYAGVCHNTLKKYRMMGLKIAEINGVKRISKKEIDRFLEEHSF